MENDTGALAVNSRDQVLAARHMACDMGRLLGFNTIAMAEIETVAAELATNLARHARRGTFGVRQLTAGSFTGIEIECNDQGPGFENLVLNLEGGHSTGKSLGIGLSGITRLVDEFYIQSGPNAPTAIRVRKWTHEAMVQYGGIVQPFPGETVSGDDIWTRRFKTFDLMAVMDGLGHGQGAHVASQRCLSILEDSGHVPLESLTSRCHRGLQKTRGAAMSIARIQHDPVRLEHVSIGNVDTRVYNTHEPVRPYCYNGTLGMIMKNNKPAGYPLGHGAIVVMASDGIKTRFSVDEQNFRMEPAAIARSVFSTYQRGTDDASVLVAKVR